jgi:XRE family aerobic/anaerobic benzoate catabolism transcriptional regulator
MPDGTEQGPTILTVIGRRVRAARKMNGLSRKALAQRSGVSERHLAQLEGGAGNISILLLERIAGALGLRLANLVAEPRYAWEPGKARRVALIGLRGAGKTTLGRAAAAVLDVPFAEMRDCITEQAGLSSEEIFALYGDDGFRRIEARILAQVADRAEPVVLTTAGGIVSKPATFNMLLARFHTVWLRATPEEHMDRVLAQGDRRPMAGDPHAMAALRDILDARNAQYERADATIDTAHRSIDDCTRELIDVIRPWVAA